VARRLTAVVLLLGATSAFRFTPTATPEALRTSTSPVLAPGNKPPKGVVNVLAASSLTDAFTVAAQAFERIHPKLRLKFSFVASSAAVSQVQEGAPVDLIATADRESMTKLTERSGKGELVGQPRVIAANSLSIAVQPKNPSKIAALRDLSQPDLVVVMCAKTVPCGRLANQMLERNKVSIRAASREANVRAALGRVISGDADAAIVYRSDIVSAGKNVSEVTIPAKQNVRSEIPAAPTLNAKNPSGAAAFIDFLLSTDGQLVLARAGFQPPPTTS
jgi:molybdate transport system substrate-binding protein